MTNRDYLEKLGVDLNCGVYMQNLKANQFFQTEDKKPITLSYSNDNGVYQEFTFEPNNCDYAFMSTNWDRLTISQKIRILRWKQIEFFHSQAGNYKRLQDFVFFLKDDKFSDVSYSALTFSDCVFWNLDALGKMKGYEALDTVLHETVHCVDFANMKDLMTKYKLKYVSPETIKLLGEERCFMALPVEGQIYNYLTKEYDSITPKMQDDILLIKNQFVQLNVLKATPNEKRLVGSYETFNRYLKKMFYFNSPLEVRAFKGAYDELMQIYDKNKVRYELSDDEKLAIKRIKDYVDLINRKTKEIQKGLNLHIKTAVNLEFIARYNELLEQNGKEPICPNLMELRNSRVKRFYLMKFKGREVSYEKNRQKS